MEELVVLVTPEDQVLGQIEKMKAHETGLLHRAFSVFLFNENGEMLLQKRASEKYHSPDQWTNAVCSHPKLNETYIDGAKRRLQEELGITTALEEKFNFIYKAEVGQNLWEHELDHVFAGKFEGEFNLNKNEVSEVRYISMNYLENEILEQPQNFTEWFKIILKEYKEHL